MIDPASIELADFLATWYGPPARNAEDLPDSCNWLPTPLKKWHMLTSRWDKRINFTTKMLAPERIRLAGDGTAIFMIDSTGDWRWCFDPVNPDTVFEAGLHEPWEKMTERMSQFLVHGTVREAVYGAGFGMHALSVPDDILRAIIAPMEQVGFDEWNWPEPGYRILMGEGTLAIVAESVPGQPGWDVEIGAFEPSALSKFEDVSGVDWRR
ncbi:hypothetical protein ACIG0C_35905 [Kitasatospora aureofaciens]|uniref:Uncharacterized protein n=1 Tax=Kitasatospora aureofaciens TaxID=1894 RepID=A0A8H9I5C5_KITAU|nr:hypothetical protein [Kitasatospora aureofaciens]GGV05679.1 hypothetical protein GCM10010502_70710 [Kitasatospora aureofaciens]